MNIERILLVHNRYQHRGGEDSVFDDEHKLLVSKAHQVETYVTDNEQIHTTGKLGLLQRTIWSSQTTRDLDHIISRFKPDIIHAHNTFPLISPSLFWIANKHGIPTVLTLHNFRLACPQAMFLRNEKVCEDCLGKVPWRGVLRSCYRHSTSQTAALTSMLLVHRAIGTWTNQVTQYIALSEFSKDKFIQAGIPACKIKVKPNFVDFPRPTVDGEREGFLFVGRLSKEKGIATLAAVAKANPNFSIKVAGSGPERHLLEGMKNVHLLGQINNDQVKLQMQRARILIVPSICYENFPRTIVEAFANNLPVIASNIGAMPHIVADGKTGVLFQPNSSDDLARAMRSSLNFEHLGNQAREEYELKYSSEINYNQLMKIYKHAKTQLYFPDVV